MRTTERMNSRRRSALLAIWENLELPSIQPPTDSITFRLGFLRLRPTAAR